MRARASLPVVIVFMGLALVPAARVAGQIVTNGGFETGSFTSGWSLLSDLEGGLYTIVSSGVGGISPQAGGYFASFSNHASNVSGISQTFSTVSGQSYTLSYWFTNSVGSDIANEFKVTWNGSTLIDSVGFSSLNAVWTNQNFVVTGTGSDTLTFSGYQYNGRNGLDAVSLTAIPEPSAYRALCGLAALGCVAWRRCRV